MKPNNFYNFLQRLFVAALLMFMSFAAIAHGPKYTHLAKSAVIAEDVNGEWTADDVAAGKYDSRFSPVKEQVPNLNFTTSTFWIRLKVASGKKESAQYLLEAARPLTNTVNLYRITRNEAHVLYETGDDHVFNSRPITYRKFIFPITIQANDTLDLMFKVSSDGEVISMPIKLWDQTNFNAFIQRENLTLGLYYGLLIFVIGLFLFFAFIVKQRIYTFYVSYVAFLFFMQASLDGLAYEYFWPNSPWLANHSILFFSGASVFMIMLYAAEFLQLKLMPKWYGVLYRSLMVLVGICVITGLSSGMAYELTFPVINAMSLISLIIIMIGIGWNQKTHQNVNLFFALGFISVLIGGIVFILTNFNVIDNDFLSHNAIKLGSAAEVTFLSMAMVGRYRNIQREKESAQREAFENLQKLNEVTSEQNVKLERQVKERTAEIEEKSEELEEKNNEIIDSITYARRIQEAILPPDQLFESLLPRAFVLYVPKDIVAGDFYWLEKSGDQVLFAAADCTGHGVPGAMVSVVCNNALNRSVREFGLTAPEKILDQTAIIVDETFEKSTQEVKDGMDISLCTLGPIARSDKGVYRKLQWAGANNPIWVISKNDYQAQLGEAVLEEGELKLYEIKANKQPIGRYPNRKKYSRHEFTLNEGDCFYLFSDGFPDQFGGPSGKKYKSKNFKRFLLSINEHPMDEQKHLVHYEFHHWRGELEQLDDVCVIGVRV
ncbi:MAG: 7TM diverse intracellular signaling domain-containing protein [Salibacteraceae bacterium]